MKNVNLSGVFSPKTMARRKFLLGVLRTTGQITLATSFIYSVSLMTSDEKFGGLTAGAKAGTWVDTGGSIFCGSAPVRSSGAPCDTDFDSTGRGGMLGQNRCRALVCTAN